MTDTTPESDAPETGTDPEVDRRKFLTRAWQAGAVVIGGAGLWTTWDLLRPPPAEGFGGLVRAVPPDAVPETGVLEVPAARAYLVRVNDEVVALSRKCTHLGCGVPFCDTSGQFECPCHGSVFNRAGDYRAGPAPRGMDRYPVEEGEDGLLYINTGDLEEGPPPGTETIDEPATGPSCETGTH
ncbi:MAG: ubiquinol-cytochrome c reductase iron-sulfur subunit [Actinomycetota bacterium]|nr:ubiquinol-cytochrome c reductase iron-sulfur subunit [Actinomycetota bacterium]